MEARIDFVFDGTSLTGITVHWTFDDMFTEMILLDYDRNKNRRLEPAEIKDIEKNAFSNLRHYNYFTWVMIDGREREVTAVRDFTCRLDENKKLVYSFFVPLDLVARPTVREVRASSFDVEYFSDIVLAKNNTARVLKGESVAASVRQRKHPTKKIFGGTIVPDEIVLEFRRKP
jgi:ABC-type uncharacterized transport system substrate-binding protein